MRSPTLPPIRMNAADTSASSAIADWTPLTVVSRSSDHRRDRHVHQRCVDDEHEHRHRQQDREQALRARGLLGTAGALVVGHGPTILTVVELLAPCRPALGSAGLACFGSVLRITARYLIPEGWCWWWAASRLRRGRAPALPKMRSRLGGRPLTVDANVRAAVIAPEVVPLRRWCGSGCPLPRPAHPGARRRRRDGDVTSATRRIRTTRARTAAGRRPAGSRRGDARTVLGLSVGPARDEAGPSRRHGRASGPAGCRCYAGPAPSRRWPRLRSSARSTTCSVPAAGGRPRRGDCRW